MKLRGIIIDGLLFIVLSLVMIASYFTMNFIYYIQSSALPTVAGILVLAFLLATNYRLVMRLARGTLMPAIVDRFDKQGKTTIK